MDKNPNIFRPGGVDGIEDWFSALEAEREELGYFQPLGPDHSAIFTDEDPVLFVTFETLDTVYQGDLSDRPLGFNLAKGKGWSQLCILANHDTWFREPRVYGYFDRLVDDGFFEDFDHVVFYGEGMCGYAAAAYSVAAPGAQVITVQPQATLDPSIAGWDHRFAHMRRTDFSTRYGFAPDMIDAANKAFVIYDPFVELDAVHAALYTRRNVVKLPCRHLGRSIGDSLIRMKILEPIIAAAMKGELDHEEFYRLFRQRRRFPRYLKRLLSATQAADRPVLTARLCKHVLARGNSPRFEDALEEALSQIRERGILEPEG
ncbi:MAG: phosphoadenosine phosphosulfate reductase [Rhodobacteraceae bacterium]|nr:phosphoadenosine phosphosulfate reductase [Paracoccaceae bacterium]